MHGPATPAVQRRRAIHLFYRCTQRVWAVPGSFATTTGMVSFPRGTEMFQFPRCPPCSDEQGLPPSRGRGCPIRKSPDRPGSGSPELIAACPRPSSALLAKASTVCPCSLVFLSAPCLRALHRSARSPRAVWGQSRYHKHHGSAFSIWLILRLCLIRLIELIWRN